MEYLRPNLFRHDRFFLLGRSYPAPWIKDLIKKENRRAGGLVATWERSTAKSVSSNTRTEQSPAGASRHARVQSGFRLAGDSMSGVSPEKKKDVALPHHSGDQHRLKQTPRAAATATAALNI